VVNLARTRPGRSAIAAGLGNHFEVPIRNNASLLAECDGTGGRSPICPSLIDWYMHTVSHHTQVCGPILELPLPRAGPSTSPGRSALVRASFRVRWKRSGAEVVELLHGRLTSA